MKRYAEYKDTHEYGYSQIPHHWDIKPTRAHFSFGKGLNITKANLKESGIAVLSYGQIHSKHNSGIHLKPELIRYVDETYLTSNSQCLLGIGDFVFADTSEDIEGSGNSAYNDSYKILFAGYHTVIARPKDLSCLPYIAYLFKSREWKGQIQKNVNAVKVYSIGRGLIKQTYLLIPPIEEQEAIVAFLDSKTLKIDSYVAERERVTCA